MNWKQKLRVALGVVVVISMPGLLIYSDLTDMKAGVQAPLYALITATGLAVVLGVRADQRWEKSLAWVVRVVAMAAAVFSAWQWLLSEGAGTVIELIGAVGAALAVTAFIINTDDVAAAIEKQDH